MAVKLVFKKYVKDDIAFSIGEATFIDGETKSAAFDTKEDPMNLAGFSYGELRIKVEGEVGTPVLNVAFGSIDHKTGEFHEEGAFKQLEANGIDMLKVANLTGRMAINATLTDGKFKITITGEFKRR